MSKMQCVAITAGIMSVADIVYQLATSMSSTEAAARSIGTVAVTLLVMIHYEVRRLADG